MKLVQVFVPAPGQSTFGIDPASGIVGAATDLGQGVQLYFEGNRYHYANVVTFADRVAVAASRMVSKYPTIATIVVRPSAVIPVGFFDGEYVTIVTGHVGRAALNEWLGLDIEATIDPVELRVSRGTPWDSM